MTVHGISIAGMPLSAWLLLLGIIVIPLAIEFAFLRHRWRGDDARPRVPTDPGEGAPR